jgi:hypothetical protein
MASFVQMLLQVGIASPNRLLNQYVKHSSGVTPTDDGPNTESEAPIHETKLPSFKPFNFCKLANGKTYFC